MTLYHDIRAEGLGRVMDESGSFVTVFRIWRLQRDTMVEIDRNGFKDGDPNRGKRLVVRLDVMLMVHHTNALGRPPTRNHSASGRLPSRASDDASAGEARGLVDWGGGGERGSLEDGFRMFAL